MIDPMTTLAFSIFSNKGVYALLLGSGLSKNSGILTGWEITMDLVSELSRMEGEPVKDDLEEWYRGKYGQEPNYSYILEKLAKKEIDRQSLLRRYFEPNEEEKIEGKKAPTKAHDAIAYLISKGYIQVVVTTNFDKLLEHALGKLNFTAYRVLSTAEQMQGAIPLRHSDATILKIHGDYHSHKLKNTEKELSEYEPPINKMLDQVFDEYGLIICGWSSDYDRALREAIERSPNRRYSTYWTHLSEPKGQALELIKCRDATKVKISGADEFFESLAEKIQSLENINVAHPMTDAIAIATVKRYLSEPAAHIIKLDELIKSETNAVVNEIKQDKFTASTSVIHYNNVSPSLDETRVPEYERICGRLLKLLCAMSRWGDKRHVDMIVDTLQRISRAKPENSSGYYSRIAGLQIYPALWSFYAIGITRLTARKYDLFNKFASLTYSDNEYQEIPFIASMLPNRVLKGVKLPHQVPNFFNNIPDMSLEYVFQTLREPLREFIPDDTMYSDFTERFEYYKWIVVLYEADRNKNLGIIKECYFPWRFFAGIRYRRKEQHLVPLSDIIKEEIERYKDNWEPFRDGFCDGNVSKTVEIIEFITNEEKEYMKEHLTEFI